MIKVIEPGSFRFDHPVASLVDVHTYGVDKAWMTKRASAMSDVIKDIRPEPGHSFIHLVDMGAQEYYGCNRNGDGFPSKSAEFELCEPKPGQPKIIKLAGGLQEYHPTFMKYAHVYKHHQNKDPKKAIGEVKSAAYNHDMHRGELIIKVANDHPDWRDDLEKLANGKDIPFSMAAKVAYDICSSCGNRARTRDEYCTHLTDGMCDITKTGHQNFAINDQPCFFDISKVHKPADRIAWSLSKVASASILGGAELALQYGLKDEDYTDYFNNGPIVMPYRLGLKMAAAKKLAAIEKRIEAVAKSDANKHLLKACPSHGCDEHTMKKLSSVSLSAALKALHEAEICLAPRDFFKLAMNDKYNAAVDAEIYSVEKLLPGLYYWAEKKGEIENAAKDSSYDGDSDFMTREVRNVIEKMAEDFSLAEGPARKRLQMTMIRGVQPEEIGHEKVASVGPRAEVLALEYLKYQISFTKQASDFVSNLTILRNLTKV